MRRLLPFIAVLGMFFLGACANYQLGTSGKLAFHSLHIAPVRSETLLPQSRALVGARVREAFIRDERVAVINAEQEADAVLTLTLKSFKREATVGRKTDTQLARKFNLTLTVACDLVLKDGTKLMDQRIVTVQREDYVDGGQLQAEYEMLPVIADKLATEVTHAVLDTW